MSPEKAFDQALRELYPKATGRDLVALFQGKVAHTTIVNWRAGRRGIPLWAISIVRQHWRERHESLAWHLANIKERPGLQAGAINIRKYHASRNRD